MEPLTFSYRSTFKRLFLHKNKDKKYNLEGVEEMENAIPGNIILEAATMKKNPEGWLPTVSGWTAEPPGPLGMGTVPRSGLGHKASGPVPVPWEHSLAEDPGMWPWGSRVSAFVTPPLRAHQHPSPEPTVTSRSSSPSVPSSHQHRHAMGEKHTKEPGGKGKKNRNLKIGKITVSEKWRESVFRKITNANELKYLDEFLLNKVGWPGDRYGSGWVWGRTEGLSQPGSFLSHHATALSWLGTESCRNQRLLPKFASAHFL